MRELSDSEFDDIFRKRVEESDPPFDEGAWNAMEKRLQRRSRLVLLRNTAAAIAACFLVVSFFYFLTKPDDQQQLVNQRKEKKEVKTAKLPEAILKTGAAEDEPKQKHPASAPTALPEKKISSQPINDLFEVTNKTVTRRQTELPGESANAMAVDNSVKSPEADKSGTRPDSEAENPEGTDTPVNSKKNNPVRFGLALTAGPDFNSVTSIAGNKATFSVGLMLDATISRKVSVSTGLRYGGKAYKATAASYGVTNPELLSTINYVDGSCNVLEIPLRASYELMNNRQKSLKLNAGLSSYLMLKEKYVFKYTPQSGIEDYVLEKRNSNQHYLSVADISATYRIKSKASKVEFGIEPYVKIPLGGVGEGKLRLKSSGITLNMFYDLSKKNKQ